jgi:hypothetical protein
MKKLIRGIAFALSLTVVPALAGLSLGMMVTGTVACDAAKAPPQLSPVGDVAFYAHRVLLGIEAIQSIAIEGEAQGVIKTEDARKIVEATKRSAEAAGVLIDALRAGSAAASEKERAIKMISAALEGLPDVLDPKTGDLIRPYVATVLTLLTVFGS